MGKYRAKTALSLASDPKKPLRTRLVRAGEEVELTDEQAQSLREAGVLVEDEDAKDDGSTVATGAAGPDTSGATTTVASDADDLDTGNEGDGSAESTAVDLPDRPSNGASKDTWRAYLDKLSAATADELGPLEVPADATRDQMIQIGDERVAEYQDEES